MHSQKLKNYLFQLVPYKAIRFIKKHINLNYLFFGRAKKNIGNYVYHHHEVLSALRNRENDLPKEVARGFQRELDRYLRRPGFIREYVLACNNCIIEPEFGWAIDMDTDRLVFDSISNNAWLEDYHPNYLRYKKFKQKAIYYPELISLQIIKGGEKNYWHFFHDILSQLDLAKEKLGAIEHIPILISEELGRQKFLSASLAQSQFLSGLNWVVQKDRDYIKAGTAYFLQTSFDGNKRFFNVRDFFDFPPPQETKKRKIFSTRNTSRIRHLKNTEEIESIAKSYGFEIVDGDHLRFEEKAKLYSEARYLVGIHGAGLTDILFRKGASLNVLELFPDGYFQPVYFWLSSDLGFDYRCLVGSKPAADTSFVVSPEAFEKKIREMLAGEENDSSVSEGVTHRRNQTI